jgi:hypothetical protein
MCAVLRRLRVVAACGIVALIALSLSEARAQNLDDVRSRGLAWLIANQNGDGSWGQGVTNGEAASALATDALRKALLAPSSYPYAAGLAWLANSNSASIDSLARRTRTLAAGGSTAYTEVAALLLSRNITFAWGAYPGYETSYPDTPLALGALRSTLLWTQYENDYRVAIYCQVLPAQRADGGWGYGPSFGSGGVSFSSSAVIPTAYVLSELHALRNSYDPPWDTWNCPASVVTSSIAAALISGRSFLANRKKSDGGYGDGADATVIETAVAYESLRSIDPNHADTAAALGFLLARQAPAAGTGPASWGGGEAFTTAMVLSVLPPPSNPLADSDQDGIPDTIEIALGSDPNVPDSRALAIGGGNAGAGLAAQPTVNWRMKYKAPSVLALQATGGTPPRTWSKVSGALPSGVGLNPNNGELSGVPNTLGAFQAILAVTDSTATAVNVEIRARVTSLLYSRRDFQGDFKSDILWRHQVTGENYIYPMNGLQILPEENYIRTVADQGWQVVGRGDFDGDGNADILWRHGGTGENYIYPMNGTEILPTEGYIRTVADQDWQIAGVGDFDGDGRDDVLWRNASTGENYIYLMNGLEILPGEGHIRTVTDLNWQIAGVGDFDGDGKADILWRDSATGENYIYPMSGTEILASEGYVRTVADLNWDVAGAGDFDGDGKTDILWHNSSTGENYVYPMNGTQILASEGYTRTVASQDWQVADVGDYDGDGRADILWRNTSTGENYIWPMDGLTILSGEGYIHTVSDLDWTVVDK